MTSPILGELLQRTTALRALARELVGDARADDIVQEAAIQTMVAPPRRAGPAGGWLATVVRNLASKSRRAERVRQRHEDQAARSQITSADRSTEDADTLRRLTEIVTSLPEPYRGTILARYLREQTPGEIAAATGTPVRTVKTRLQRGLALLRQRLDEHGGDWRVLLAGTFALESTTPLHGPTLLGTTMKITLLAAALVPVGLWIWGTFPDPARAPSETTMAVDDSAVVAGAPPPGTGTEIGRAGATPTRIETPDQDTPAPGARSPGGASESAANGAIAATGLPTAPPAPAAATQRASARVAPPAEPPFMRLDIAGPAAFCTAFLPTNLGRLLDSGRGERLWRPLLVPVERIWQQWDGRGDDFQAARQRALAYGGRIRVLWMVQPGEEDERDRIFGVFALGADGATDLAALADDLERVMQSLAASAPTEQNIGVHALRLLGDAGSEFVTLPLLIDGRLVAFFGEATSLDQIVPRCLRALAADTAEPTAPLSFHIDLAQIAGLAEMRDQPRLMQLIGLESLRSFQASVRPNGRHAELELEVEFGDGRRGLMAGLLPAVSRLPALLARVPAAATPWLTVPLRLDVLFGKGLEIAALERRGAGGVEAVRQELHRELGLHLDTELLDHLSGEIMVLGDLWQSGDPEVFRAGDDPPLGACIALSLRDSVAFGAGLDKLLEHFRASVNRFEVREVDGVEITRLGSVFLTGMHVAVGQDLFAIAFGNEGVAQLEALVAGRQTAIEPPLPEAIRRVRQLAPAGWNGVGLTNLQALFSGQVTLALEALDDAVPQRLGFESSLDDTQQWLDELRPLIARYQLDDLVTMTGHDGEHWRLRLLW